MVKVPIHHNIIIYSKNSLYTKSNYKQLEIVHTVKYRCARDVLYLPKTT